MNRSRPVSFNLVGRHREGYHASARSSSRSIADNQLLLRIKGILLLFIMISFVFVEKLGRRPLLLGGGVVMAVCLFAVGGLGFRTTLPGAALVALTCIWTAAYALSAGPLGEYLVLRLLCLDEVRAC